jgi:hypothetical protein
MGPSFRSCQRIGRSHDQASPEADRENRSPVFWCVFSEPSIHAEFVELSQDRSPPLFATWNTSRSHLESHDHYGSDGLVSRTTYKHQSARRSMAAAKNSMQMDSRTVANTPCRLIACERGLPAGLSHSGAAADPRRCPGAVAPCRAQHLGPDSPGRSRPNVCQHRRVRRNTRPLAALSD